MLSMYMALMYYSVLLPDCEDVKIDAECCLYVLSLHHMNVGENQPIANCNSNTSDHAFTSRLIEVVDIRSCLICV